jgi:predicted O-methyltransferase YrrM
MLIVIMVDLMDFMKKFRDMLSVYGDKVELVRKRSLDAALDFEDGCLDFVFIDGAFMTIKTVMMILHTGTIEFVMVDM